VETRAAGEGAARAAEGVRAGVGLIVAVGGDGTLNEVVNGITDETGRPLATLGAILTGRGRDGARTLGVPRDPARAIERLAAARAPVRRDLGLVRWPGGHRYFVTVAGAGFDAVVAARALTLPGPGTVPYLRAVVTSLRDHRPWPLRVRVDDAPARSLTATAVIVANGSTCGGGMRIAPGAHAADGLLDLVMLGALSRAALLRWLPTVYWGGHLRHPRITVERVRAVTVTSDRALPLHIDGEPCGAAPFEVTVVPGGLRVRA
jgi:diacylglycerol kinase (ATP)